MKFSKTMTRTLAFVTAMVAPAGMALAAQCPADFPSKPINFIVGYGAGGGTDAITRAVAAEVEKQQGWTLVTQNQPGAGGGVMAAGLMNADPDGYTVGATGFGTVALNPYTNKDTPFTYEDFEYLGSGMQTNYGMVTLVDAPYSTFEEFIDYAKEKGRATVSIAGVAQEIFIDQVNEKYGTNIVYLKGKGAADALQQALGGHVDATIQGARHAEQVKAGKMKQLASLIDKRLDFAPDSKTLIEIGFDTTIVSHTMFITPKGVPADVLTCLAGAIDEAIGSESYNELMKRLENKPLNLGPEGVKKAVIDSATVYKSALE